MENKSIKYALITGASSGIGKGIAIKVAIEHNYHVLVNYLKNDVGANETVQEIKKAGGSAETIRFNVAEMKEVESVLNTWREANNDPVIEVVINNAGVVKDDLFIFMDEEKWDAVLDVKLKGFYNVTKNTIEKMLLNRYGRIINIASLMGLVGNSGQVNYSAANGGLISATRALAKEIGKK